MVGVIIWVVIVLIVIIFGTIIAVMMKSGLPDDRE
jgi:hypothetical protein